MKRITTTSIAIRYNGCTLEYFQASRGLIFPLIFNLCMAKLSMHIDEAVSRGHWQDIFYQSTNLHLSNISYVDDVVIFGEAEANLINIQHMLNTIENFCQASRQRINFTKCHIIVTNNIPAELDNFLFVKKGFIRANNVIKYLDFPYIHNARYTKLDVVGFDQAH